VGFGIALLVVGGFLLGGAYSVWTGFGDQAAQARGRSSAQAVIAVVLLLAAVLASVAGLLYLV
jgi:uncharacterized protein involved in response to NO